MLLIPTFLVKAHGTRVFRILFFSRLCRVLVMAIASPGYVHENLAEEVVGYNGLKVHDFRVGLVRPSSFKYTT